MALGNDAYVTYGQGLGHDASSKLSAIPRNKYIFSVELQTLDGPVNLTRIANVQMPSFVYRTQTLNRYNNKSVIQTGIDYTPITLTAYDTKDAAFETFLKNYAKHYFAGPMNEDSYSSWLNGNKGFELRDTNHYITSMLISRKDTNSETNTMEIFHPFIQNADADTLDYSDSSPSTFRVSFQYEGYRIKSDVIPEPPEPAPEPERAVFEEDSEFANDWFDESSIYQTDSFEQSNVNDGAAGGPPPAETEKVTTNKPDLKPFKGTLKTGEKIRNIDGKSYVVPAPHGSQ